VAAGADYSLLGRSQMMEGSRVESRENLDQVSDRSDCTFSLSLLGQALGDGLVGLDE
jgi:hypothetical protein